MSMRTTQSQRDAWSDHANRLMAQDNPNELVLSAAHTLDLLADLDDARAPQDYTEADLGHAAIDGFMSGMNRAWNIAASSAHTCASENADRYRALEDASAAIAKAIEAEMLPSLPQAPPSRTFDDGLRDRVIVALAGYMLKLQGRVIDLPIENMRVEFGDFADAIIAVLRRKDRQ